MEGYNAIHEGNNGTCYTKSQYEALTKEHNSSEWMIVVKKQAKVNTPGWTEIHDSDGSIQNCDQYLTSVKDNLPTSKEIPDGAREIQLEYGRLLAQDEILFMNYDWRLKGGLACQETSCPKLLTAKSANSGSKLGNQVFLTKNLYFNYAWVIMFTCNILEKINNIIINPCSIYF